MALDTPQGALDRLGLSAIQAEVYLTLLQKGPLRAAELSEAVGMPRTRIYEVAKALENQGFVSSTMDTPTRFLALPIRQHVEETLERLRTEQATLAQRLPELERILAPAQQETAGPRDHKGLIPLRSAATVRSRVSTIIGDAEREIWACVDPTKVDGLMAELRAASKAGIRVRVLHHITKETLPECLVLVAAGGTVRHQLAPMHLANYLVDDTQCAFIYPSKTRKAPTAGLWTDDPHFVQAQKAMLESIWRDGVPLHDRQQELEGKGDVPKTTELRRADRDEDPQAVVRAFVEAAERVIASAQTSLDMTLPSEALAVLDPGRLHEWFSALQVRLLIPGPPMRPGDDFPRRLSEVAEVRVLAPNLSSQCIIVRDRSECLIAAIDTRSAPHDPPSWESTIISTEPGLVSAFQAQIDQVWARSLDIQEADSGPAESWWFTSHRAADAAVWIREALSTAVHRVEIRHMAATADLVPILLQEVGEELRRDTWLEGDEFAALVVLVDDRLCLVIEEPVVDENAGRVALLRVGHVTFTNSPAIVRNWRRGAATTRRQGKNAGDGEKRDRHDRNIDQLRPKSGGMF